MILRACNTGRVQTARSLTRHTSKTFSVHPSGQAFHPIDILLCLFHNNRMTLLQNFMYRNQCFEGLYLICQYRLPTNPVIKCSTDRGMSCGGSNLHFQTRPKRQGGFVIPSVDYSSSNMFPCVLVSSILTAVVEPW